MAPLALCGCCLVSSTYYVDHHCHPTHSLQAQLQGELEELAAEGKAGGTAAAAVQ